MTKITLTGDTDGLLALSSDTLQTAANQLSPLLPLITSNLSIIEQSLNDEQFTGAQTSNSTFSATLNGDIPGEITFKGSGLAGSSRTLRSVEFDPQAGNAWNWKAVGSGRWSDDTLHMSRITSANLWNDNESISYLLKGNIRITSDGNITGTINSLTVTSGIYSLLMVGRINADNFLDGMVRKLVLADTDGNQISLRGSLSTDWLELLNDTDAEISDLFSMEGLFSGNDVLSVSANTRVWYGYGGNDQILGGEDSDTLDGGIGNDKLMGFAGNDSLYGDEGNDRLFGGTGNDMLMAASGNNQLFGDEGNDQMDAGSGNDRYVDRAGNNRITDAGGNNRVSTGAGDDVIHTHNGNDVIQAGDGNNEISDTGGNNVITTGSGNDTLIAGAGHDVIRAGAGNDWITSSGGRDKINAGDGDDIVELALTMGSIIAGGAGNDTLSLSGAGTGNTASGVSGFETLLLTSPVIIQDMSLFKRNPGFITLSNAGVMSTFTQVGESVTHYTNTASGSIVTLVRAVDSTSNALTITGKSGTTLAGITADNEEIITVASSGTGAITLSSVKATDLQTLNITGAGAVTITSLAANSTSSGSTLKIDGSTNTAGISVSAENAIGNAEVIGSATASSTIAGGDGNDTITGGAATDWIAGGAGADLLTGGAGEDTFQFDSSVSSYTGGVPGTAGAFDTIADYQPGQDLIDDIDRDFSWSTDAVATASAGIAGISHSTGIASFDVTDDTLTERVAAVNASLAAGTEANGQIAVFEFGSDTYVYIYDDTTDAVDARDGLIKLTGVTGIDAVDLTTSLGNLMFDIST